jgi:hypothetical protein
MGDRTWSGWSTLCHLQVSASAGTDPKNAHKLKKRDDATKIWLLLFSMALSPFEVGAIVNLIAVLPVR